MRKSARKTASKEAATVAQTLIPLASVIRNELFEFVVSKGLQALEAILEAEREAVCGPAYERQRTERPHRAGSSVGKLVMGGRQIEARKPRVRHKGCEVRLPSWEQFSSKDPLEQRCCVYGHCGD